MRIIAGSLGGRRLKAPPGSDTRPTADRVREAIFNILGPPPPGTRVLDAFAGAGALGLEALSRGASEVHFIDSARAAVRCVRDNVQALDVAGACRIHCGDALALLRRWSAAGPEAAPRFRWLFLDPPYRAGLAGKALEVLGSGTLLDGGAVVVVEHDRRNPPADCYESLVRTDRRRYGDTEVSFYRPASPARSSP